MNPVARWVKPLPLTRPGFFLESSGNLMKWTPEKGPIAAKTVRERYAMHHSTIRNTRELRSTLRAGPTCHGYGMAFCTSDGACLCWACAREEYCQVSLAIRDKTYRDSGWRIVGTMCEADSETAEYCDHCGELALGQEPEESDEY